MGYKVDEKETRECFTVQCANDIIKYIWAYNIEEAKEICKGMGYIPL